MCVIGGDIGVNEDEINELLDGNETNDVYSDEIENITPLQNDNNAINDITKGNNDDEINDLLDEISNKDDKYTIGDQNIDIELNDDDVDLIENTLNSQNNDNILLSDDNDNDNGLDKGVGMTIS